ncbi:glycoside hydrolase family 92 protein [Muribaculaceae bacterium Isolate-104 (HZI)]|nr:glycoside hydrolase family 92 protein [Muribaculaceae bacterium Isolate-104 (HZI)]
MKTLPVVVAAIAAMSCVSPRQETDSSFTRFVNPLIGSGGHGHVFVGASVPFGMVQLGPTSIPQAWDWTSGYHERDSTIIGFSHTHLSGTGIGDLFDITVMPVIGSVKYARGNQNDSLSGLWSYGVRSKQVVRPGYYSVPLERYGINAELTATSRVGFHRYTFPATDSAAIVFDLQNGGCWDRPVSTYIKADGSDMVSGHRFSSGWAADQKVYFAARFSEPFDSISFHGRDSMFCRLDFPPGKERAILVKVALSPTSEEAAKANLEAEIPGWNFDSVAESADMAWNRSLAKIRIESSDSAELVKFYTALFHTMICPAELYDVGATPAYTTYSLWDTYRAEMPLLSIIEPERSVEMINDMLAIFDTQGRLPVWHLWRNETDCMVGNPGIIAVADAVVKELPGIDGGRALKAMVITANDTARGGGLRQRYGYIPCDMFNEAVAYDMEYAIADAAVANAALALGDSVTATDFISRSHSYRNYFDPATGFIRGRYSDGGWRTPFDPFSTTHRMDDYCEGNAWQYTWLAPHDVAGLEACFGSRESMLEKLDSLFMAPSVLTGDASPDITGLIGQYAHGNEPGHHTPYLYTMLGHPRRTSELVRRILDEMYTTGTDGLCGNEDAGQMSAWFVLSFLGFYQVEPAGGRYWFGSPRYEKAEVEVPGGTFVIVAKGASEKRCHIASVKLNGKPYDLPYITHRDIVKGGVLEFEMSE